MCYLFNSICKDMQWAGHDYFERNYLSFRFKNKAEIAHQMHIMKVYFINKI